MNFNDFFFLACENGSYVCKIHSTYTGAWS